METWGGWVIDLDISSFFDTLNHAHLRSFLEQRIGDGVILRAIGKWLNAGVIEAGEHLKTEQGSPQGGVISPLLANIYLHYVLDTWFATEVRPRMRGQARLYRYADDAVLVFEHREDAERVFSVLPKRLGRYGLKLHPEKTRLIRFRQPPRDNQDKGDGPGSFDFLGFTHYWAPSHRGISVVQRRTSKKSFRRSLRAISDWCRKHRHLPLPQQQKALSQKLLGHYLYFGVVGNIRQLGQLVFAVQEVWRKWLGRRHSRKRMAWECFNRLLLRYPLPRPRICHFPARP
jgi:RNA-directed DNA polymerase